MLLGYYGKGARGGTPGSLGALDLPTEVVSSEFLTMEGRKFSSSRVGRHLRARLPGPLRRRRAALLHRGGRAGEPGHRLHLGASSSAATTTSWSPAGATWSTASISLAAKNFGAIPAPGAADRRRPGAPGARPGRRSAAVGELLEPVPVQKAGDQRGDAGRRRGQQVPVRPGAVEAARVRPGADGHDPARRAAGGRRRARRCSRRSCRLVAEGATRCSAATGAWAGMPRIDEVDEDGGPAYPVITGDYDAAARAGSRVPIEAGHAAGRADAAVHQARPVDRRRGAGPAGAAVTDGVSAAGAGRARRPPPPTRSRCRPGVRQPLPPGHDRPARSADVVAEAAAGGITRMVTVGTDLAVLAAGRRRCRGSHADVYAAVAIHPNETAAAAVRCGEGRGAGRDRRAGGAAAGAGGRRDRAGLLPGPTRRPSCSRSGSGAHIAIAKQAGKALVIHDRDAHDDVLRILDEEGAPDQVVFHCFSGDAAMAQRCVGRGLRAELRRHADVQERASRCGTRPRSRRWTSCWSRPTRRSSRRCRTGASRTRPARSRTRCARSPRSSSMDVAELCAESSRRPASASSARGSSAGCLRLG